MLGVKCLQLCAGNLADKRVLLRQTDNGVAACLTEQERRLDGAVFFLVEQYLSYADGLPSPSRRLWRAVLQVGVVDALLLVVIKPRMARGE